MGWEAIVLKVPQAKQRGRLPKNNWLCPRCAGKPFLIPSPADLTPAAAPQSAVRDEREFLVLTCDRCGQFMAFEGCSGNCAASPRSKCEICGKYYCPHCGITADIDLEERRVELRYCNDHVPEWYKNR